MIDAWNFKDRIDKMTKWVDQRSLSIGIMIGLATALWLFANLYYNDLSVVGIRMIKRTAKELGTVGFWCAAAAFAYYAYREAYVYGRKKSTFIKQHQSGFSFVILILRRLHIWFGVLAIAFIIDHGCLMWFVTKNPGSNLPVQTGFIAVTFMGVLVLLGICIRRYPAVTKFRFVHRFFAFLFFAGSLIHLFVIK